MTRDALARHIYVHALDSDSTSGWGEVAEFARQKLRGGQWDDRQANNEEITDCYARADQMIAEGRVPA